MHCFAHSAACRDGSTRAVRSKAICSRRRHQQIKVFYISSPFIVSNEVHRFIAYPSQVSTSKSPGPQTWKQKTKTPSRDPRPCCRPRRPPYVRLPAAREPPWDLPTFFCSLLPPSTSLPLPPLSLGLVAFLVGDGKSVNPRPAASSTFARAGGPRWNAAAVRGGVTSPSSSLQVAAPSDRGS